MKYLASVRYGLMMTTENFQSNVEGLSRDATVILRTERGIEWGRIAGAVSEINRDVKGLGEIIRVATEGDHGILRHIQDVKEPEELSHCAERAKERGLAMRLVGVEHMFSGDKVIFYFIADGRVDFRELVKDLARRYRTRIEMRQIGVRDEARLLADYEHCGRELCCRTFIRSLEPVTMRMAKMQKTTLDPTKISGHCGRLMCCLRFEDDVYNILRQSLPPKGTLVQTPTLRGEVLNQDVLKQTVLIELGDGTRQTIHVSEIVGTSQGRREGGPRNDHSREDRPRNDRDRPRDNRPRNDRPREDRPRPEPSPESSPPPAESPAASAEEPSSSDADAHGQPNAP